MVFLVCCLISIFSFAQPPVISYLAEITGLSAPVDIVNAGDGTNRLFIVQQAGIIQVRNGLTVTQFANFGTTGANIITSGGERGLLSMAFHPWYDGVSNRYFYIYYTDLSGNIAVSRCETTIGNINTADISTLTNIITIPHPGASNHNGGKLNFGPDGYLYFATGDGGGSNDVPNNAQTGTVLLGKMLRIDIDQTSAFGNYAVPLDNPYIADPNTDDRIWALGLRNPYRWSFDRLTGDMWIGDVGQGAFEEINFRPAASTGGVNYGWRCYEGYASTPGVPDCIPVDYVPPVYDYPNPSSGSSSVVGGFVYRGSEFPNFRGYYMATDVYSGDVFMLWPNGSGGFDSSVQTSMPVSFIVAFGEAEDGTLYAASQGTNTVYKVIATGGTVLPVKMESFTGLARNGYNELHWKTATEQHTTRFHIEYSKNGSSFSRAGTVPATGNMNGSRYRFSHITSNQAATFYRLAIEDNNGSVAYSDIIRLAGITQQNVRVYSTVINNRILQIESNGSMLHLVKLFSSNGMLVYKKEISGLQGTITCALPVSLAGGMYFVEIAGNGIAVRERVLLQ